MKHKVVLIVGFVMATILVNAQNNENIFSKNLGDGKIYLLSEGQGKGNSGILIGVSSDILEKYAPGNSFPNATNAFLWQIAGKNILFDTGYGRALLDNLQSIQVKPEAIDAIFITHMHGDHIGGLLRDGKAVFPHAALYLAKAEHAYWTGDEGMNQAPENRREGFLTVRKVVEAYKDRLHLFEPTTIDLLDKKAIYPGIQAIASYGHTPGHTVYLLESKKSKLLIWGDLTHAMAIQMPHPEIAVTYDVDAKEAVQSRLSILKFVSDNQIPVAGMHITYPGIGNIKKSEAGYRFVP